jgi:hypothetical protein
MAAPVSTRDRPERPFDMRALRRLAGWGMAATLALLIAVLAGFTGSGPQRVMAGAPPAHPAPEPAKPPLAARSAEVEAEAQRLADAVRNLAADRDRLAARLDTLERGLEDVTGSIKRQAAAPAEHASPAAAAPGATVPPAPAAEASLAPASGHGVQADAPGQPIVLTPPMPAPRPAAAKAETAPDTSKPDFGIDIGGAANFNGLRVLWVSAKENHAVLLEGLHPIVAVRENSRTKAAELRLVIGPISDIESAARICATLAAAHRYCQPVGFEGQRLADADAVIERKPAPAAKPAAKPAPKAAPTAARGPRLFFQ